MLSQPAHDLTSLLLARKSLVCRAAELDAEIELVTALHDAATARGTADDLDEKLEAMIGELLLTPALLDDLDARIAAAWGRLKASDAASVKPSQGAAFSGFAGSPP